MDADKIRNRLKKNAAARVMLMTLSLVYAAAAAARKALYGLGILKSRTLGAPVVCFGNISTGGTGKTSTVAAAAIELSKAGKKPAILMRGYKRGAPAKKLTVLAGPGQFSSAEAGDEAFMLYNLVKDALIPVMVCADRCRAGAEAIEKYGCDILLMDDGLQHFALRRNLDIILVNAAAPFYKDSRLPLGNLREGSSAFKRAGAVIISHCERAGPGEIDEITARIKKINPDAVVMKSCHRPDVFIDAVSNKAMPLTALNGREAAAFSGIGDPESFEEALKSLGVRLKQIWRYPDHHRFTSPELRALENSRGGAAAVTTYKDFVRFPAGWREELREKVYILSVKISFLGDGAGLFMAALLSAEKRRPQ